MKAPRILFYDVETSLLEVYTFGIGPKVRIGHEQIKKGSKIDISCICYKWSDEPEIHSLDWGLNRQNSDRMIKQFTKIVESADIAVAHNGDKFDWKQINTQRFLHGQDPIAWPTSEDTLKQLRKHFAFPSNRLDYITKTLFGSGKSPMCFQDWVDVQNKNKDALEKMIRYCKRDVLLLDRLFKRLQKYVTLKSHIGVIAGNGKLSCPSCGSLKSRSNGRAYTKIGVYQRSTCISCGFTFKGKRLC